jgi:hypothetical protein
MPPQRQALHFSVDDVCASLLAGLDEHGQPLHPAMRFVQRVHDELHLPVALYLFWRVAQGDGRWRTLSEAAGPWLGWFARRPGVTLGPHALDAQHAPHRRSLRQQRADFEQLESAIRGLVGGRQQRAPWVRLHEFSECHEWLAWWQDHGVLELLTTDKPVGAWRLDASQRAALLRDGVVQHRGMRMRRSHLRLEHLVEEGQAAAWQRLPGVQQTAVVFTHEYELERPEVQAAGWCFLQQWCRSKRR